MLDPVLGLKFHTPINTIFKCISPSQSSSPNILLANPTVFSDRREALQHCDLKERNVCYSDDQNIFLIDTRSLSMGPAHSSWNPWYFLRDKNTRSISCSNTGHWPLFPTQGSWNLCNFLGESSIFCSRGQLWVGSWMKTGEWKDRAIWIEAWNFQPYPPFPWEGRGDNNWSCLYHEASTKPQ